MAASGKLLNFVVVDKTRRLGVLHDGQAVDVNAACRAFLATAGGGDADAEAPANLLAFIERGPAALDLTTACLAWLDQTKQTRFGSPLAETSLAGPWPGRRIACAGANDVEHLFQTLTRMGVTATREEIAADWRSAGPQGFWKVPHEVAGPEAEITYPARTTRLDYEGEIAVVIGRGGKDIPAEAARDHIWGVTLMNDWSDRDNIRPLKMPLSFNLGKNFDGGTSLGPSIAVGGFDLADLRVQLAVNGELRQDFSTKDMMFSFEEYIAYLSRDLTLMPGDIISGGTGAGTAMDSSVYDQGRSRPDRFLKPGDVVEVRNAQIGELRNRIVAKV